ncbi:hypothetical protein HWV62_23549 [Athelia sp. TMB]|nr:hypothetical protein HWV62_23549 [Athelia sp. TMB]
MEMEGFNEMHDLATQDLALRIGGSKTGLLNASMSNMVEMVIAITALRKCELKVVQSSLIGSMLSKMLLVLGACFFAGGLKFSEQDFNADATQIHSSLLSISVGALLLPAAYHFAISTTKDETTETQKIDILKMSHGLWSHTHFYTDNPSSKEPSKFMKMSRPNTAPPSPTTPVSPSPFRSSWATMAESDVTITVEPAADWTHVKLDEVKSRPVSREGSAFSEDSANCHSPPVEAEHKDDEELQPELSWFMTLALMVAVTIMVSINAEWLVESLDTISTTISKEWIALIMVPAISSIAECVTAVNVSVKDRLTLSVSVAISSTIQTALFVIPFMVTLGWALGKPLALLFDPFESVGLRYTPTPILCMD